MSFAQAVTILDTIAGGNQRGGELLGSEWGVDMGRFGTAARLAAWSGVAPATRPSENEAATSDNVALRANKTTTSSVTAICVTEANMGVPQLVQRAVCWHIDKGTDCGTALNPL
jgi:transposase